MVHLDDLTRVAPDPVVFWNSQDEVFEIYFGQADIDSTVPVKRKMTSTSSVVIIIKSKGLSMTTIFNSLTLARQCTSLPITLSTPWLKWPQAVRLRGFLLSFLITNRYLGPTVIFDEAVDPLPEGLPEMLGTNQLRPRPYGLRSSPRQFLQLVASHVPSSSGHVKRGFSELRSLRNEGRVYMVSKASATSRASRHSRPESFNDISRQHIGRPERILRELQFPAPASDRSLTPGLRST
jgi:hypothetical protein